MRDHERAHVGADELLHAFRDDLERVDVETGVGLVEHGDLRLQHRHLQDLDALLLAAREPVVQVARRELAAHLQVVHLREEQLAELGHRHRVVDAAVPRLAHGVDRLPQEVRDGDARDRVRVLEGEEEPGLRALVGAGLGDVLAVEEDLPLGDLVGRVAGDRVGERRLARAVRAHDRVHLVRGDREIDALDDLRSVLQRDVQVLQLQLGHGLRVLEGLAANEPRGPSGPTLIVAQWAFAMAELRYCGFPAETAAGNAATLAACQTSARSRSSCCSSSPCCSSAPSGCPEIGRSLGAGCVSSRTR